MKFNEPDGQFGTDEILVSGSSSQLVSLSAFVRVSSFISTWVNNDYGPDGGDPQELQLDALHIAAQDMNTYSTAGNPSRYIVLITDNVYHEHEGGSTVWKQDVITELTNSGCKVYISLWVQNPLDPWLNPYYEGLLVNGGEFDVPRSNPPDLAHLYPLDNLRARILANWPSD